MRILIVAAALLVACSDDEPPRGSSGGGDAGGGGSPGGEGGAPSRIQIDATEGALALDFDIDVTGVGSDVIGTLDLTRASGTIEIGGETLDAVVYERQPFAEWVIYQTLVVASDRWYVVWPYCNGDVLEWVYYESTDGTPIAFEAAAGSCAARPGPITVDVRFPATDMAPPALVPGFTIDGPAVHVGDGAPGRVALATEHLVYGFGHVDCTEVCGSPGWRELHALLWDPPAGRACFGIFYLFEDAPQIQLTYALTLPDLSDPAGQTFLDATWSYQP